MRFLGLDYGEKTIGVSISDPLNIMATGLEIIRRPDEKSVKKSVARLREIITEHDIKTIVLGYPKHMNNSEGARCQKTQEFRDRLNRNFKNIEVVLWDERLSTVAAGRNLKGMSPVKKKEVIDMLAAVYILQGYLDYLNNAQKRQINSEGDKMSNENEFEDFDDLDFDEDELIESVTVTDEEGNEIEFYILDALEHNGVNYLLVIDDIDDEEEAEATIIKEVEVNGDEVVYELIDDENEFNTVAGLFESNTEDYDIEN